MVSHARLVELFGDSPAIKVARRIKKPVICLNYIDEEWVLTWTTGENEVITVYDVKKLTLEPLYEETISYIDLGDKHRRIFKSEGKTWFDPENCPVCYDGLSFKKFSKIEVELATEAVFYLNWDQVGSDLASFTYNM